LIVLVFAALPPAMAAPTVDHRSALSRGLTNAASTTTSLGAGPGRTVHRWITRGEHSTSRLFDLLSQVGFIWLWIVLSAAAFLVVAALSSVVDIRMFDLRRKGAGELSRYLGHGTRTFFRILRDRHTPYLARSVLAVALLYWLIPFDVIPDHSLLPGFVDDLVIAFLAAKGFMYLCPDSLVAVHAAAVEARAQAQAHA